MLTSAEWVRRGMRVDAALAIEGRDDSMQADYRLVVADVDFQLYVVPRKTAGFGDLNVGGDGSVHMRRWPM
jgi:hypothetical protein